MHMKRSLETSLAIILDILDDEIFTESVPIKLIRGADVS